MVGWKVVLLIQDKIGCCDGWSLILCWATQQMGYIAHSDMPQFELNSCTLQGLALVHWGASMQGNEVQGRKKQEKRETLEK